MIHMKMSGFAVSPGLPWTMSIARDLLLVHLQHQLGLSREPDERLAADASRLLHLLEFQLRTLKLQPAVVEMLLSLTLAHGGLVRRLPCWPRSLATLKYLCQKYNSSKYTALVVLCIGMLADTGEDLEAARRQARCLPAEVLNSVVLELLRALYQRDGGLASFCAELVSTVGWDAPLIRAVLAVAGGEETDSIYERLSDQVKSADEVGGLIGLLVNAQGTVENLLCAHDCLVRLGYPLDGTRQFSRALSAALGRMGPPFEGIRWVFANICLNLNRFLDGPRSGTTLKVAVEILQVLIGYHDVQQPLGKLLGLLLSSSGSMAESGLGLVLPIASLVERSLERGEGQLRSAWRLLCRQLLSSAETRNALLEAIEGGPCPGRLWTVELLDLVNPRLQHYLAVGDRTLALLQRATEGILAVGRAGDPLPVGITRSTVRRPDRILGRFFRPPLHQSSCLPQGPIIAIPS